MMIIGRCHLPTRSRAAADCVTDCIFSRLDLPYYSGITAIGQALVLAKTALEKRRPSVKVYVVVVTDGFSYDEVDGPAADLRAIPDVTIFSAGVAHPVNEYDPSIIHKREASTILSQAFLKNTFTQRAGCTMHTQILFASSKSLPSLRPMQPLFCVNSVCFHSKIANQIPIDPPTSGFITRYTHATLV